jgi:hypothetical protein
MSADPTVPDPSNGQDYNRYAYVLNNPLSLTDPTGFQRDPPRGIQQDPGNGIGAGGQIGKSTPANGKLCDCSLRGYDSETRLAILEQLRALQPLASVGDTMSFHTASATTDFWYGPGITTFEQWWDNYSFNKWYSDYLRSNPMSMITHHAPHALVALPGMAIELTAEQAQELCGECAAIFDEGVQMSIGDVPGAMVLGALKWSRGITFYRGVKPGQELSFVPKPNEYRIDPSTGFVSEQYGVSVFDNSASLVKRGFEPYQLDLSTVPKELQIKQRGLDPSHFEITPAPGANLTPQEYIDKLCQICAK